MHGTCMYLLATSTGTAVHVELLETSRAFQRAPEANKIRSERPPARSAGSHISQFFDLLQFLGHQKIFYKTCMCAVKVALNFLPIQKSSYYELFGPALI